MRDASSAGTLRPVSMISKARCAPTRRTRRCVPPKPGMTPSLTSGCPKTALGAARMRSQHIASSQPPPNAKPCTAAMVGAGKDSSRPSMAWPLRAIASASAAENPRISAMSAPAAKARFPAPVTTSARSPSPAMASSSPPSSSTRARLSALSFSGRWRVMRPTPSVTANWSV